jgi:hypothetical protein
MYEHKGITLEPDAVEEAEIVRDADVELATGRGLMTGPKTMRDSEPFIAAAYEGLRLSLNHALGRLVLELFLPADPAGATAPTSTT